MPARRCAKFRARTALWLRIVFAFYLLACSLLNLHWQRIRQRVSAGGSAMVYAGFGLMMLFVIYNDGQGPFTASGGNGGRKRISWPLSMPVPVFICSPFLPFLSRLPPIARFALARLRRLYYWLRRSSSCSVDAYRCLYIRLCAGSGRLAAQRRISLPNEVFCWAFRWGQLLLTAYIFRISVLSGRGDE